MSIGIIGLGCVSAVQLASLAREGHGVFGFDIEQATLDLVNMRRREASRGKYVGLSW